MAINDNVLVLLVILLCVSTCGKPDIWDGATNYLIKNDCKETKE